MSNRKEAHMGKAVDDTLEVVNDFNIQIPFWGYQPTSYRDYEPFTVLISELDSYLEKLFAGAKIDDGNGDVLDCIIADRARENVKFLLQQQVEKRSLLKNLEVQRQGARHAFEEHLNKMKEMYAEKLAEKEDLRIRYQEDKFEGGKRHA